MDTCYTNFQCCSLSFFSDHCFYFSLCFFHHLLNSCRMDTTIYDQSFQSNSCDFTTNWVKSGQYNRFRCIINNQFNTCQRLKGTDITSLTSDNSSFHFIAWKLYNRNCCLSYMICCTTLNGTDNIFFCFLVSIRFCLCLQVFDHLSCIMLHIIAFSNMNERRCSSAADSFSPIVTAFLPMLFS